MTYPIILAHGIARFDLLARQLAPLDEGVAPSDSLHYFRCIASTLRAAGFDVYHSDVEFAASVEVRSASLRTNVEAVRQHSGAAKVHIIAHSMGGLDARHMLYAGRNDRLHETVASLTTVGTPHLGTSFADWGVRHTRELFHLLEFAGIHSLDGFRDLTRDACLAFDARAAGFESQCGVLFQTVVGTQPLDRIFAPLQVPWFIIREEEGPNDGLVSASSAEWRPGYCVRRIDADHLNEVGWWDSNEIGGSLYPSWSSLRSWRPDMERALRQMYVDLARDLANRFPKEPA